MVKEAIFGIEPFGASWTAAAPALCGKNACAGGKALPRHEISTHFLVPNLKSVGAAEIRISKTLHQIVRTRYRRPADKLESSRSFARKNIQHHPQEHNNTKHLGTYCRHTWYTVSDQNESDGKQSKVNRKTL